LPNNLWDEVDPLGAGKRLDEELFPENCDVKDASLFRDNTLVNEPAFSMGILCSLMRF
jgi:hypothetical protein